MLARAADEGIEPRITGIMPDAEHSQPGLTRVFSYAHADRQSPVYEKQEYLVPPEQLAALVQALLYTPNDMQVFASYRQPSNQVRELLVCNHGSRDRCCATFGF